MQVDKELLSLTERPFTKWTLSIDGSNNVSNARLGIVLISPKGDFIQ